MSANTKVNPEVQPRAERRSFSAEYKRRLVLEAEECRFWLRLSTEVLVRFND
jgi:hypothetical protein